ncbi:autophagy protein Apg5-domain-containing protein [Gigaspora rosea]|uniref:Autophagy protein 5 n=1 Tax=Gigaspora rosea TaxID=44941 RepID=A0A397V2P6_9GLOM|nr:autophagy protein Apg5-domain-containing protein [Gigaspora rosea]CAG8629848.1 11135_t:CDS:2 [Gigaspora rosea]
MTAPQNPITRAIWDGTLPIKFSLDSTEAAALGAKAIVEPYFIEAPRCSYFPLWTSQIRKYFVDMALNFIGDDAEIWYDVDGTPLKWHYPIGLLYDLHTGYRPDSNSPPPLPWPVTVHFKNFPADKLIKAQAIDATQDFFMSMIKEADFLRNGSTKKVMNLSKNDQTQLWDGLWSKNYDRFWSVNYRLVINDGQMPKHVPMRIYLPDNCPVIQEPISPVDENGNQLTLGDVLHQVLPELFPSPLPSENASAFPVPVIHGIIPQLEIPIVWASQNLCYPDNFLHIVVLLGI